MSDTGIAISVIVPCYNQEKYISDCIESILAQKTDFRYEILVGDDFSSDSTPEILKEYAEKYPGILKLYLREENLGATTNVYKLFQQAKGEYIAYLEGDDYWCRTDKLQIQYDYMKANPELIACYHRVRLVDRNGRKKNGRINWIRYKKRFSYSDIDGLRLPGHSSTWLRKNVMLENETDYSVIYKFNKNIGDRTAMLYFLSKVDFGFIDEVMSCYRYVRTDTSITTRVYNNHYEALKTEYDFILSLSDFAEKDLKRPLNFNKRRRSLFFRLVCHCLIHPSEEMRALAAKAYADYGNKPALIMSLIPEFFSYIFYKIFYLE